MKRFQRKEAHYSSRKILTLTNSNCFIVLAYFLYNFIKTHLIQQKRRLNSLSVMK